MHRDANGWPGCPRESACDAGGSAPVLSSFFPSSVGMDGMKRVRFASGGEL